MLRQDEIGLGHQAQRQPFKPIEIKEAVLGRERDGLQKRRARILPIQREQPAQRQRPAARTARLEGGGIRRQRWIGLGECLFLR